jgi:hypothetical protein
LLGAVPLALAALLFRRHLAGARVKRLGLFLGRRTPSRGSLG